MMTFPDKDFEALVLQEVKEYGINYSRTDIENIYIKFMYAYSYLESHFFCNQKFQLVSYEEFFPELGFALESWGASYVYSLGYVEFLFCFSQDVALDRSGFFQKTTPSITSKAHLFRLLVGDTKKNEIVIAF